MPELTNYDLQLIQISEMVPVRGPTFCLQASPDLTELELQRLFDALDVDNTGSVDSQEFFAGVLQAALLPQQTHTVLEASFKLLDRWVEPAAASTQCVSALLAQHDIKVLLNDVTRPAFSDERSLKTANVHMPWCRTMP
jgi:hypothetical protein